MATTYTPNLDLPKHAITDPFDITLINEAMDKTDAAVAGKAPAGYGLGVLVNYPASNDTEIDNVLVDVINSLPVTHSFKRIVLSFTTTTNFTGGGGHWYTDIYKLSTNYAMITAKTYFNGGQTVQRVWYAGELQPWEFANPSMVPGVEYRTTKRHNGKAVYAKLVEFGALPNNAEKSVIAMPENTSLIAAVGYGAGPSYNVPIPGYYAIASIGSTRSSGALWIKTSIDMTSYNGWITIEYTK